MQPVVEGNGVGKKRGVGVGGFLIALCTAGALTHVAVRMKGIEVAYDLGRERRTSTELEEQRRRLQIEIGMLKDPGRVVSLARDKLQMGPPASGDIVRAGPGALMTLPAPASEKPAPTTNRGKPPKPAIKPATAPAVTAVPAPPPSPRSDDDNAAEDQ